MIDLDDAILDPDIYLKVVGIGGGGCHALRRLAQDGMKTIGLVAVDTDDEEIRTVTGRGATGIRIGDGLTHSKGSEGRVKAGERAAKDARDTIENMLFGADLVAIVARLGDGTGTGAAPVVADIARELDKLSIGIFMAPSGSEPGRALIMAEEAVGKMRDSLDAMIVIKDGDALKLAAKDAFHSPDEVAYRILYLISGMFLGTGYVKLDIDDLMAVLRKTESSDAAIGIGESAVSAVDAARKALASPLLDRAIDGARGIILHIVGDEGTLTLADADEAVGYIQKAANADAEQVSAVSSDATMAGKINVMILALFDK